MDGIVIPVGTSDFAKIRSRGFYYVDKSGLIAELLKTRGTNVTLITRPRRFGKTLVMSMLSEFFDIRKISRCLFEGLAISVQEELCRGWMNQYPTLFLSFKSIDGLDFFSAYGQLKAVVAEICKQHLYLLACDRINSFDKAIFNQLAAAAAPSVDVKNSLLLIVKLMEVYYGKPVILLIDEYDVPLAKASEKRYYPEMLDMMKGMMQVLKDNSSLEFAVITGCLRIAKESIFSGTNNFVSDTISDTRLNEYFGFTEAEVGLLLKRTEMVSLMPKFRAWYDGYHFGETDVYCPWDVMNYVKDLLLKPTAEPIGYWKNSSDNAIIRSFVDYAGNSIIGKFEMLLSGGVIVQSIVENLTYDYLHSTEENLWTILYMTGYLTRVPEERLEKAILDKDSVALAIPNAEVMEIFEDSIKKWFDETSVKWDRKVLFAAIWNRDEKIASAEMTGLLRRTISYHDYREDFYHAFLAGIFAGAGYAVESNKEHGEGRSDVVVRDYAGDRVVVFEAKYSEKPEDLASDCAKAIAQIDLRNYAEEFAAEYTQVLSYGISFYKKRCMMCLKTI